MSKLSLVEGYLPYLLPADRDTFLKEIGLSADYHKVPIPDLNSRRCGWCAEELLVVENAKRILCEACGHIIDVSVAEFPCPGCGTPVSMPVGKAKINCRSCGGIIRSLE